jgi:hypothetical protein
MMRQTWAHPSELHLTISSTTTTVSFARSAVSRWVARRQEALRWLMMAIHNVHNVILRLQNVAMLATSLLLKETRSLSIRRHTIHFVSAVDNVTNHWQTEKVYIHIIRNPIVQLVTTRTLHHDASNVLSPSMVNIQHSRAKATTQLVWFASSAIVQSRALRPFTIQSSALSV